MWIGHEAGDQPPLVMHLEQALHIQTKFVALTEHNVDLVGALRHGAIVTGLECGVLD